MQNIATSQIGSSPIPAVITLKYCLYARKSSETEERQALSIDSQIKEMKALAEREELGIVDEKKESHSAKETGQRPDFNQMVQEIKQGKFNAILVWHPDRLSRNAGDLGAIVDLMDQKLLIEIRTFGQRFTNSPSDKFLLMILCSQAKLENDNKSINVKRGLRTRCEMGLWPAPAPTGYLNSEKVGEKGIVYVDKLRAPIMKKVFEKVAYEGWSGRKVYFWLRDEVKFQSLNNKNMTLSNVYLHLRNHFYYGNFEYPKNSSKWYKGKHEPIITKELFDLVQTKLDTDRSNFNYNKKEFAFTQLMKCGVCGSGITAQEKFKPLANGTTASYIYYSCCRFNDKECKNPYIREEELIKQLFGIIDNLNLDQLGMKEKIKEEVSRYNKFQSVVLGTRESAKTNDVDMRNYAKYILKSGTIYEKRELMSCLKSKISLKDKKLTLA